MDETNATRVSAPPAEVAERGNERSERHPAKAYVVTLRVTTSESGKFTTGLLVEFLKKRGFLVDSVVTRFDQAPLASYYRAPRGQAQ